MRANFTQRLIAAFCLIVFSIGGGAFGPLGVKCEDPSGRSSYELACVKSSDGACLADGPSPASDPTAGGGVPLQEDGYPAAPCKDSPIGDSTVGARTVRPGLVDAAPAAVAVLHEPEILTVDVEPGRPAVVRPRHFRPPDALERLRTIVLLV